MPMRKNVNNDVITDSGEETINARIYPQLSRISIVSRLLTRMSKKPSSQGTAQSGDSVLELARKGFASASNYEKVRPDYPIDAVEAFLQNVGLLNKANTARPNRVKILELGSGTGKFTRIMLQTLKDEEVHVIASEPLENMCEHFKRTLPETELIRCAAESIDKSFQNHRLGDYKRVKFKQQQQTVTRITFMDELFMKNYNKSQ
ncbi:uncharacterized protein LOC144645759 [Oculina patagonica]